MFRSLRSQLTLLLLGGVACAGYATLTPDNQRFFTTMVPVPTDPATPPVAD